MPWRTGDVLLFAAAAPSWRSGWWVLDAAIALVTRSPFTHVGLVLVDPPFARERGAFLWESGYEPTPDAEDGARRFGVRLTPLADVDLARATVRRCVRTIDADALAAIHADVYAKPYDARPLDWALAAVRADPAPQRTDRFWCSAFVVYVLARLGWVDAQTDWSVARPADLSASATWLRWTGVRYGPDARV
jgi:hypothetical protein